MTDPHATTPDGRIRARGAGLRLHGAPGPWNAITDVDGVQIGYATLIAGDRVRTGVTAILPRPPGDLAVPVFAGFHSLNGNGELTGALWAEETGRTDGPITITNTHACGIARDAAIKWMVRRGEAPGPWSLPVAGETYDGYLNDINGFHVTEADVFAALDAARTGPVEAGSVGGGTGMILYGFKGGSGTASRRVTFDGATYTVGVFVQANFGRREQLVIAGVPVGRLLGEPAVPSPPGGEQGSVIGIAATDAPLMPHQLKRLARRFGLGIGRSGAIAGHGSGDIFLALSTANRDAHHGDERLARLEFVPDRCLDSFFEAVIQATDEAVLDALFANETMRGRDGHVVEALPHEVVREILSRHGALV